MGRVATPYLLNKIMTTELDVKTDSKIQQIVKTPKNYHVILLNDEVTPMDFVVELLVKIFKHSPDTAKNLTMKIHTEGSAIVGTYTYELAEQKGTEATNESRSRGFPLQVKIDQE
jgi:ATP-dependent Clp protease adaptor protein ClpS